LNLNLQPGDLVRVKSYGDILATLDSANKNRGLFFDAELVPFCSRELRVKARLTNFGSRSDCPEGADLRLTSAPVTPKE
jgi:hypothetical protein